MWGKITQFDCVKFEVALRCPEQMPNRELDMGVWSSRSLDWRHKLGSTRSKESTLSHDSGLSPKEGIEEEKIRSSGEGLSMTTI